MIKNIFNIGLSGGAQYFSILLVGIVIARFLGVEQFGQYSTAMVFSGIFLVFVDLGFNVSLLKSKSRSLDISQAYFGNTLLLTIVLSAGSLPAMWFIADLIGYSNTVKNLILLFGIYSLATGLQNTCCSVLQAQEKIVTISILRIFIAVNNVLVAGWIIFEDIDVTLATFGFVITNLIITLPWLWVSRKACKPKIVKSEYKSMFSDSYLYLFTAFFYFIYFRIDTVMLSVMKTQSDVGVYSAAYQIIMVFIKLNIVVSFVTLPVMFKQQKHSHAMLYLYESQIKYMGMLGIAITIFLISFAEELIQLIYTKNESYEQSIALLKVLSVVIFFKFITIAPANFLTATDNQLYRVKVGALVALVNIFLNIWLIPIYGVMGAAITTVLSDLLLVVATIYFANKLQDQNLYVKKLVFRLFVIIGLLIPIIIITRMLTSSYIAFGINFFILCFLLYFLIGAIDRNIDYRKTPKIGT